MRLHLSVRAPLESARLFFSLAHHSHLFKINAIDLGSKVRPVLSSRFDRDYRRALEVAIVNNFSEFEWEGDLSCTHAERVDRSVPFSIFRKIV